MHLRFPLLLCALASLATRHVAQHLTGLETGDTEKGNAGHRRMLATLARVRERAEREDPYLGTGDLAALREALVALPPEMVRKRWDLLCQIGSNELRLGNNEAAVFSFQEACDLNPRLVDKVDSSALRQARFELALSWLRLGETRNCVARHTSESCILPIGKRGVHADKEGSTEAIAILLELLEADPLDVSSRWILNLAYMTVGEYPQGVPERFLIPPSTFASDEPFPRFVDDAPRLGLNSMTLAGGVIVDDFDADGLLDVVTSSMDPSQRLEYFAARPDGTFVERGSEAGFDGLFGGLNLVQADYDNDGGLDLFVPRGAWLLERGQVPNSLLHNNRDGTFTDVSYDAGLAGVDYPTQVAAWADYDNDGDLDLFVGNENGPRIRAPCQLFRNQGNGTFSDVARSAGVTNDGFTKGASWGDFDGDRLPDLYVSNLGGANRLYRNRGNGTFEDVAERLGVAWPERSFATWFWDYDNDGVLDLYVTSYLPVLRPWVLGLLGQEPRVEPCRLYRGDGKGGFRDVAREVGLGEMTLPMGANFGDLDNDGFLDFYLGTGFPQYQALMPNKMYWNRGGKRFADVTTAGGFGHLQKGHGIAFADIDRDGDQDVFAEMGGAYRGDAFGNALFRNPGTGNHWIGLKLVGTESNRSAIGARIRCTFFEEGAIRSVFRHVNSGGSFGANPLRQTLGLGRATRLDELRIDWPASGRTQIFHDVPIDRAWEIAEGFEELTPLP